MAVFTPKVLCFGQLAATDTALYTPANGATGLVHNILIFCDNDADGSQTPTISLKTNDAQPLEYPIISTAMPMMPGQTMLLSFQGEGLVIPNGWTLMGYASIANCLTIKIDGSERV